MSLNGAIIDKIKLFASSFVAIVYDVFLDE